MANAPNVTVAIITDDEKAKAFVEFEFESLHERIAVLEARPLAIEALHEQGHMHDIQGAWVKT